MVIAGVTGSLDDAAVGSDEMPTVGEGRKLPASVMDEMMVMATDQSEVDQTSLV